MSETSIAGVTIPDSALAREITELVKDTESPLLFDHSSRVYYWGALTGQRRGLRFDPELLYAGAMFHDMGLTPKHASAHQRFEVDGANVARDFLRTHNIAEQDIETVWTAIALHTTPGIPQHMHPLIALVTAGVEMDVLGVESNGRDLLNAIDAGDFPRWALFIQVMTDAQARTHKHNPFDLTKVWSQKEYPLIEVGVMELNRYPENYFAEVEQAAFSPANIVPGIGFSPDKMLQGRLFSYGDTQRYRLGVNFNHIPVNAPKCPFLSYHRDGKMRTDGNLGGTLSFNPNSDGVWDNQPDFAELPMPVDGDGAHYDHRVDDDHWEQPGNLFRLMTSAQQQRLFDNTARAMGDARPHIKERHVANCLRADPAYGEGVARALGLSVRKAAE
jgi:Catalase/Catalase-related immune-responsive/HD domain